LTTDPDVILSIRDLIVANTAITDLLASYLGAPAVFTRVPVPDAAPYPMITISRNQMQANEDGLDSYRPVLTYEISAHGRNDLPPTQYRDVGTLGTLIRALFHRRRNITLMDWGIIDQRCTGPTELSPVDQITTRSIRLTIRASILVDFIPPTPPAHPPSLLRAGGAGFILNTTGGTIAQAGN
jgi:hypothetical protein